ncbi:hypothetical protein CXF97_08930 [Pseudomonas sp. Choline-02u-1]|nr:hypothetical protein CXF97_08930 [Pseudomonas sp. Choline-02u-1]
MILLLILQKNQKIAAFGSSYKEQSAPFIQLNGAFVCYAKRFLITHGIMRAVMTNFRTDGE